MMYSATYLSTVMECPAKARFLTETLHGQRKPDTVTELQLYFDAVEMAIDLLVAGKPLRSSWDKAIRRHALKARLHKASFHSLVGRGVTVLSSFTDTVLSYEDVHAGTEVKNHSVYHKMPLTIGKVHVLLIREISKYDLIKWEASPVKTLLRLTCTNYCEFNMYTGRLGKGVRPRPYSKDEAMLKSLIDIVKYDIVYPRPGPHCRTCQWNSTCTKTYQGEHNAT